MSQQTPSQPVSNKPSTPRKIAKFGVLGAFMSAGALEFVSFAFFGCPCLGQPFVIQESNTRAPVLEERAPSPPNSQK